MLWGKLYGETWGWENDVGCVSLLTWLISYMNKSIEVLVNAFSICEEKGNTLIELSVPHSSFVILTNHITHTNYLEWG